MLSYAGGFSVWLNEKLQETSRRQTVMYSFPAGRCLGMVCFSFLQDRRGHGLFEGALDLLYAPSNSTTVPCRQTVMYLFVVFLK